MVGPEPGHVKGGMGNGLFGIVSAPSPRRGGIEGKLQSSRRSTHVGKNLKLDPESKSRTAESGDRFDKDSLGAHGTEQFLAGVDALKTVSKMQGG